MMSDKDNNLLKSDILTVGSELSEKLNAIGVPNTFGKASEGKDNLISIIRMAINGIDGMVEQIMNKQDKLISGVNIKTINNQSILGSGNISTLSSSDVANNLTTTSSGKVLDARQGKELADLIGDAITYINQ